MQAVQQSFSTLGCVFPLRHNVTTASVKCITRWPHHRSALDAHKHPRRAKAFRSRGDVGPFDCSSSQSVGSNEQTPCTGPKRDGRRALPEERPTILFWGCAGMRLDPGLPLAHTPPKASSSGCGDSGQGNQPCSNTQQSSSALWRLRCQDVSNWIVNAARKPNRQQTLSRRTCLRSTPATGLATAPVFVVRPADRAGICAEKRSNGVFALAATPSSAHALSTVSQKEGNFPCLPKTGSSQQLQPSPSQAVLKTIVSAPLSVLAQVVLLVKPCAMAAALRAPLQVASSAHWPTTSKTQRARAARITFNNRRRGLTPAAVLRSKDQPHV